MPRETRLDEWRIGEEAARWLLCLEAERLPPDVDRSLVDPAFLSWLRISPRHVRVFLETYEAKKLLENPASARWRRIEAPAPKAQDEPPASGLSSMPADGDANAPDPLREVWAALHASSIHRLAAGVVFVAVLLALVTWPSVFNDAACVPMYYTTGIGERRIVALDDGSSMTLNTSTRVAVRFRRSLREVRLLAGEVLFDIRHDTRRPFVVMSDDVTVEDAGTRFSVDRHSAVIRVWVLQGRVRIFCDCAGRWLRCSGNSTVTTANSS